jgi:hypothetical protein
VDGGREEWNQRGAKGRSYDSQVKTAGEIERKKRRFEFIKDGAKG